MAYDFEGMPPSPMPPLCDSSSNCRGCESRDRPPASNDSLTRSRSLVELTSAAEDFSVSETLGKACQPHSESVLPRPRRTPLGSRLPGYVRAGTLVAPGGAVDVRVFIGLSEHFQTCGVNAHRAHAGINLFGACIRNSCFRAGLRARGRWHRTIAPEDPRSSEGIDEVHEAA